MERPLRVFVSPGCAGCQRALDIVGRVRRLRPELRVEVVDLAEEAPERIPDSVVGTPAYLIGERVVSFGNPALPDLLDELDLAAGGGGNPAARPRSRDG